MKMLTVIATVLVLTGTQLAAYAGPDDRQDRRQERGRSDERQDRIAAGRKVMSARTSASASRRKFVTASVVNRASDSDRITMTTIRR